MCAFPSHSENGWRSEQYFFRVSRKRENDERSEVFFFFSIFVSVVLVAGDGVFFFLATSRLYRYLLEAGFCSWQRLQAMLVVQSGRPLIFLKRFAVLNAGLFVGPSRRSDTTCC